MGLGGGLTGHWQMHCGGAGHFGGGVMHSGQTGHSEHVGHTGHVGQYSVPNILENRVVE